MEVFGDHGFLLALVALLAAGGLASIAQITWQIYRGSFQAGDTTWIILGGLLGAIAVWVGIGVAYALLTDLIKGGL